MFIGLLSHLNVFSLLFVHGCDCDVLNVTHVDRLRRTCPSCHMFYAVYFKIPGGLILASVHGQ
jgi:hypothetical protein